MKTKIFLFPVIFVVLLLVLQSCCPAKYLATEQHTLGINKECMWSPIINLTKAAIHGSESWRDPIGFQAGAEFPLYYINEPLSVRAGGLVSLQGANWEESNLTGTTRLWYAYVPVVLRYQHKSGFYGEAGLQPGFLLSAKDKYEGTTDDYMDHMNRFDLGIPLGMGYKFKNNLCVKLSVVPGVTDITKDADEKDVNFVMGLGLAYNFKIK